MGKKKTFLAGHVGVDAGLVMIGDPGYIIEPSGQQGQMGWDEFVAKTIGDDRQPDVASEPLGKFLGIVMPSGQGDGIYPVYITLGDDGRPEAAMIVFK